MIAGKREKGFTLLELLIVVAIVGIIAAIAIPNLLVAIQRARQRRSMMDMRNIASALESRNIETGRYNASGAPVPTIDQFVDVTAVSTALAPTYIKVMPRFDGWGNNFQFYTNQAWGSATNAQQYAIISGGADGQVAPTPTLGSFQNFDCDIIYSNGAFLAFPEGAGNQQTSTSSTQ
jgi:general secretion pathway protein G